MYLCFFNWSVSFVLACSWFTSCGSFRWTAKGLSHSYIRVSLLPQTPLPSRLPHRTEQSSLCSTWSLVGHPFYFILFYFLTIRFKYSSVSYCEPLTECFSLCWVQANNVKKKKSKQFQGGKKTGCALLTERECAVLSWGLRAVSTNVPFLSQVFMLEISLS